MKQNRGVFQAFSMIGQFGINMIVPIFLCSFLGHLLDKRLGTSYLVIVLFFVGAVAGGYNVFRMARSIYSRGSSLSAYGARKETGAGAADNDAKDSRSAARMQSPDIGEQPERSTSNGDHGDASI